MGRRQALRTRVLCRITSAIRGRVGEVERSKARRQAVPCIEGLGGTDCLRPLLAAWMSAYEPAHLPDLLRDASSGSQQQ